MSHSPENAFDGATIDIYTHVTVPQDRKVVYYADANIAARLSGTKAHPVAPGADIWNVVDTRALAHLLLIDVGRWGGGNSGHWKKQRNFGLAIGRSVFVCEFDPSLGGVEWSVVADNTVQNTKDGKLALLICGYLSQPGRRDGVYSKFAAPKLGGVRILDASTSTKSREKLSGDVALVLIGDLHLPVRPDPQDAYAPGQLPGGEFLREARLSLHSIGPQLGPIGLRQFKYELMTEGELLTATMDAAEIVGWTDMMYGRTAADASADIFEADDGAADDLLEFALRLKDARELFNADGGRLKAFQLGDMYEMWQGLEYAKLENVRVAQALSRACIDRVHHTKLDIQRYAVNAFQDVIYAIPYRPSGEVDEEEFKKLTKTHGGKVLHGNHDDYLQSIGYPGTLSGKGLHMEHGHQPDVFNGEYRASGHFITQLATVMPSLRNYEETGVTYGTVAARLLAQAHSQIQGPLPALLGFPPPPTFKLPPRLTSIDRAVTVCSAAGNLRTVYAMGHTHIPCVRDIVVMRR